jgi:hypothetical protein
MKECRIIAKDPEIDITLGMGDGPAVITGGLGGWTVIPRQDDVASTDWEGQEPLAQDVPLLLDGYFPIKNPNRRTEAESVEREWGTIKKLGRDAVGDESVPPVFRVYGAVEYPGKAWVLGDNGIQPNASSVIKRDDGELLRIEFTLSLLEYIRPDTIRRRRKKKGGKVFGLGQNHAVSYTTNAGDTLVSIAAHVLGDWKRWREIAKKNPQYNDPNRPLSAGRILSL